MNSAALHCISRTIPAQPFPTAPPWNFAPAWRNSKPCLLGEGMVLQRPVVVAEFVCWPHGPGRTRTRRREVRLDADSGIHVRRWPTGVDMRFRLRRRCGCLLVRPEATGLNRPRRLGHRLGPGDMPLEPQRFGHVAVAVPMVTISSVVAVCPRQQRAQPQQPDVTRRRTAGRPVPPPIAALRPRLRRCPPRPRHRAMSPPEHRSR